MILGDELESRDLVAIAIDLDLVGRTVNVAQLRIATNATTDRDFTDRAAR